MRHLLPLLLLVSCGGYHPKDESPSEPNDMVTVTKPTTCSVEKLEGGALISCPDGSSTFISDGSDGESITGASGSSGVDGTNCLVTQTPEGATITCGETTATVSNGQSVVGPQGPAGVTTVAISSVVTTGRAELTQCASGSGLIVTTQTGRDTNDDNILDEIIDSSVTFVCDGARGETGSAGVTTVTYKPIEVVNPCNVTTVVTNEIFLRLDATTIIAVYYTGYSSHLSVLSPGDYTTTGVSGNCNFRITNDFQIVRL